jgi:hypothetical protein
LRWVEENQTRPELVQDFFCKINSGVLDSNGNIIPMTANIYVDNILTVAAFQDKMLRLLAAIVEAILLVCGTPDILVCQCSLLLEKWYKLIVGPRQIILGHVVDTNKMTVGITDNYIECVQELLKLWDPDRRFFKVNDMQKLVGKLA